MFYSRRRIVFAMVTMAIALPAQRLFGEVASFDIKSRQPYAEGKSFGERGAYEQWRGEVRFAVDPSAAANAQIVDLELAPRNARGRVEFSADVEILATSELAKSNG